MKEYVLGFIFEKNLYEIDVPCVLLITKQKPDYMRHKLNGVGGAIERNETPLKAMRRELKEETGLCQSDFMDLYNYGILEVENKVKVHLFTAWGNDLEKAVSPNDEVVMVYPVTYIDHFIKTDKCLSNLAYLVPAARNWLKGYNKNFIHFLVKE